jgi:hypothetical protein
MCRCNVKTSVNKILRPTLANRFLPAFRCMPGVNYARHVNSKVTIAFLFQARKITCFQCCLNKMYL